MKSGVSPSLTYTGENGPMPCGAQSTPSSRASLSAEAIASVRYDGSCEDLFFYIERLIIESCGEEAAGRLHTARSRNDIDMTMYRMRQRAMILALASASVDLRQALLDLAARHRQDIFPAHTHTQPAQPSTIAHYLLAVIEQLEGIPLGYQDLVRTILPARVPGFRAEHLDELGATGYLVWIGHSPLRSDDGRIMLFRRERVDRIIRNTYKTLTSRGTKGCYIHAHGIVDN